MYIEDERHARKNAGKKSNLTKSSLMIILVLRKLIGPARSHSNAKLDGSIAEEISNQHCDDNCENWQSRMVWVVPIE